MAITYPTTLDTLTNPVGTDAVSAVDHAVQHSNVNDAVEALEAKVGVDSSAVTTSHDYKLSAVTGSNKAVTNNNGTINSPTITGLTAVQRVYTSSDTWTKPSLLTYVIVEVQAAGGGGEQGATTTNGTGAGGGGYGRKKIAVASLGATETVTVGAFGVGHTSSVGVGTSGGNSSFGSHVTATGGNLNGSGGACTGGDINIKGQGGTTFSSSTAYAPGGSSFLGIGGMTIGSNGTGYGGGGAGGNANVNNAGDGGPGVVIVTEYFV